MQASVLEVHYYIFCLEFAWFPLLVRVPELEAVLKILLPLFFVDITLKFSITMISTLTQVLL